MDYKASYRTIENAYHAMLAGESKNLLTSTANVPI